MYLEKLALPIALTSAILAILSPAPAPGQFTQYLPPGSFQDDSEAIDRILENAMTEARWTVGALHIDPWIGVREMTYDDNVGNRPREPIVEDYLVKVGAGLRGYLPVMSDMVLAGHVLPEYVYWQNLDQRRQVNGRYGIGLFGQAGPVRLDASAQRIEDTRFFSREFEDRVDTAEDYGNLSLELPVGGGFAIFAGGALRRYRFEEAEQGIDPAVGVLDRDERIGRAGVRLRPRDNLLVALGVETSEVEFQADDPRRSNSGTAPTLGLAYEGSRLGFTSELAWRSLAADAGAAFPDYDRLSGRFHAVWHLAGPLQLELLGSRNLVYSFQDDYAYFEDESLAAGALISLGSQVGLRMRYEDGRNRFAAFDAASASRLDDFRGWSAELQVEIGPGTLVMTGADTVYDSNLEVFDRSVTTVSTGMVFGRRNRSPW